MKKHYLPTTLPLCASLALALVAPSCKTPSDISQVYKPQWEVKTSVPANQLPIGVEVAGVDELPIPQDQHLTENMIERVSPNTPGAWINEEQVLAATAAELQPMQLETGLHQTEPQLPSLPPMKNLGTQDQSSDPLLSSLVDPLAINPPLEPLTKEPVIMQPARGPKKKLTTNAAATAVRASVRTGGREALPLEIRPAERVKPRANDASELDLAAKGEILALAKQIERASTAALKLTR